MISYCLLQRFINPGLKNRQFERLTVPLVAIQDSNCRRGIVGRTLVSGRQMVSPESPVILAG